MLQQTRMDVVLQRFSQFIRRFPTVQALAFAEESEVVAEWSGLGYYRRARMLHRAARMLVEKHGGVIPSDPCALLTLPGIGRYTAGAIGSIGFDLPRPIVDGNVLRVLSRIERLHQPLGSSSLEGVVWKHAAELVESASSPRILNQSLMELGALLCKPSQPLCSACPVTDLCEANVTGTVADYPTPGKKRETIQLQIPLLLIELGGKYLFRRGTGSLMRGMWHLPHGSADLMPELLMPHHRGELLGRLRHTITNRRITFEVHEALLAEDQVAENDLFVWLTTEELSSLPHPSYVKKALRFARAGDAVP